MMGNSGKNNKAKSIIGSGLGTASTLVSVSETIPAIYDGIG